MRSKPGWRKKSTKKNRDAEAEKKGYKELEKTNAAFEAYYKTNGQAQSIVPEEEWNTFLEFLRAELPTTFRVTGTRRTANELNQAIRSRYIPLLTNIVIDDKPVEAPTNIPWYPEGLGWQLLSGKMAIKRSKEFKGFHRFLVAETEVGNISRQEAVSMIPPLLLGVEPHHLVLDMCAAPGSKTAQLVEALHANDEPGQIPSGLVIANDADSRRSYMLVHQMRRLQSPCLVVTNHEAQHFPNIQFDLGLAPGDRSKLQFDRVLCDVPCSGDGTMRKNAPIWTSWHMGNALGLHTTQVSILMRGCQLLQVGGRIVYSTCSMNPIENEAVIAEVLRRYKGAVELVDASAMLPELKRRPGLHSWKVGSKDGRLFESYDDVPEADRKFIRKSNFAPENVAEMHLEHCLRIYPHLQNTGAFFVAVLEKKAAITAVDRAKAGVELDDEEAASETDQQQLEVTATTSDSSMTDAQMETVKRALSPATVEEPDTKRLRGDAASDDATTPADSDAGKPEKKAKTGGYNNPDGPFTLLPGDNASVQEICDFYGFSEAFPRDQLLVRSESDQNGKTMYFISSTVKKLLQADDISRFKLVHTGVRAFVRNEGSNEKAFRYRIQADGLSVLAPFLSAARKVNAQLEDLRIIVQKQNPMIEDLTTHTKERLDSMQPGCSILEFDPAPYPDLDMFETIRVPVWRARVSVNLLLNKQEKRSLGFRIGVDTTAAETAAAAAVSSNDNSEAATPAPETQAPSAQ
ncbi:S-adenosyl-L-methionine-dependent methyltransferase [Thamnocephalis sphaerospora]|uniref:S-adenosyl-L-methionine-dependent methyltransferase n=1 Tax=Thamnocephalis sphaerospora TaxID=78915 RepID=A0A4P9XWD1_9FUNG|nr:S-adenosyl-L-methionine-dependent methyltransferase [Thamnocephalis sphaerospora]|eukprot:RKP10624.1 S-adenosyl-L-methionine-dependent methyltransferase [Thamnocephalis sphaerospora]